MFDLPLPALPASWANFADGWDLLFAAAGLLLLTLLIIWWRQQTRFWFRIVVGALLLALVLSIASVYLFQVPPYSTGCAPLCPGWSGYPLPVAALYSNDIMRIAPLDFALNTLMLWLLWLGAALAWTLLGAAFQWWKRGWRARLLFILAVAVLPWALLPRIINPTEPDAAGEELRVAVNAQRSAEFTYRITGPWVQRLALEDVHYVAQDPDAPTQLLDEENASQVCLRGYTYFYIPWRRYRITLDASGTAATRLAELPLTGSCWEEGEETAPATLSGG